MSTQEPRSKNEEGSHSWNNCPTDILLKLIHTMPVSLLAVCMFVNSTWRSHVKYFLKVKNKWKELVNATTIYSSQLQSKTLATDWKQIFFNYILWHNTDKATVNLEQMTNLSNIKALRIYQGKSVVVVQNSVLFYDPMTLNVKRAMGIMLCTDYYENDSMAIVVTEYENYLKLHVCKKPAHGDFDLNANYLRTVEHVLCYKFHDNHCYYLDEQNSLYIATVFEGHLRLFFNARFYGTPGPKLSMNINILNNQIYLLNKDGIMMWVDPVRRNFRKLTNIRELSKKTASGTDDQKHFHWYCLEEQPRLSFYKHYNQVRHHGKELFIESYSRFNSYNDSVVFVHIIRNASCMLQHGDVLFLGYFDGSVEIISVRDSVSKEPLRRLCLKDMQPDITDLVIISIEIYEEGKKQYLLIATSSQLFRLGFTHENCDEYMWRNEVCIKCIMPRIDPRLIQIYDPLDLSSSSKSVLTSTN